MHILTTNRETLATLEEHLFYRVYAQPLSYCFMAHATYQDRCVSFYWAAPTSISLLLWNSAPSTKSFHFRHADKFTFNYLQLLYSAYNGVVVNPRQGTTYQLITQMPLKWYWGGSLSARYLERALV